MVEVYTADEGANSVTIQDLAWGDAPGAARMAYMDVAPEDEPNGKTVVLFHGLNYFGDYWEATINALHVTWQHRSLSDLSVHLNRTETLSHCSDKYGDSSQLDKFGMQTYFTFGLYNQSVKYRYVGRFA